MYILLLNQHAGGTSDKILQTVITWQGIILLFVKASKERPFLTYVTVHGKTGIKVIAHSHDDCSHIGSSGNKNNKV